jgi:hypothetical protein
MPRYGAVLFPFYIVLALAANRRWLAFIIYTIAIGLALLMLARFVTWRWVA